MTKREINEALREINTPGSELNKRYIKWCNQKMTNVVAEILQYLSNPDQAIGTVPNVDGNSACTLVGYISGRSQSASDMICLDELQPTESKTVEDNYTAEGE